MHIDDTYGCMRMHTCEWKMLHSSCAAILWCAVLCQSAQKCRNVQVHEYKYRHGARDRPQGLGGAAHTALGHRRHRGARAGEGGEQEEQQEEAREEKKEGGYEMLSTIKYNENIKR